MEALIGRIVRSCAGGDNGKVLVVVKTDEGFVYVADGRERKLASPKKKSLKHVKPTNTVIDTESLTDKKLRSVIMEFNTPDN